jgi:hypothetical protein
MTVEEFRAEHKIEPNDTPEADAGVTRRKLVTVHGHLA